jgi:hypothetical protein
VAGWPGGVIHALQQAITSRTRAILLVHPNNPTGHFVRSAEADQLQAQCAHHISGLASRNAQPLLTIAFWRSTGSMQRRDFKDGLPEAYR